MTTSTSGRGDPPTTAAPVAAETTSGATTATAAIVPLPSPVKGDADWREYRALRLPNGVTVCLVRDPESKTTAAAASVNAGAAADPRRLPGLAHFCEHMCFLGSEKYPGENEYKRYLSQHGGRSNASTSLHCTTYKFEVLAPHAEAAIDMFCQFFVSPLFTQGGTEREVNAVDSENSKNLVADGRRRLQVLKDVCQRDDHYFTKFTTGNVSTLMMRQPAGTGPDGASNSNGNRGGGGGAAFQPTQEQVEKTRRALLDFHAYHYRPDRLTVVVAGPQPLDELQAWVVPRLAPMQAKPPFPEDHLTETQRWIVEAARDAPEAGYDDPIAPAYNPALVIPPSAPPSDEDDDNDDGRADATGTTSSSPDDGGRRMHHWPGLLTYKPIRAVRILELIFPVPSTERVPDRSPTSILSHLLGHEGPNSPFAILQTAGLVTSLSAGLRTSNPDFSLFHVEVSLTERGEERWKHVADVLFQHARLIRTAASEALTDGDKLSELRRIWEESCQLDRIMFHTTSPGSVYDLAPSLCRRIVQYGTERCLSAGSRLDENGETLPLQELVEFSRLLTPANCLIERCSLAAWEEMERSDASAQTATENTGARKSWCLRKKEPWYGVDYYLSYLSQEDMQRWSGTPGSVPFLDASQSLALPRPNVYIPRTLELCPELPEEARRGPRIDKEITPPVLVRENEYGDRLWHRLDDRYALPKAIVSLLIRNAATENVLDPATGLWKHDTASAVHSSILAEMFSQAQAIDTYDAALAGLRWNLSLSSSGISLAVHGFSDRLPDLAHELFGDFVRGDGFLRASFFEATRERMVRNLRAFFRSRRADSLASYYRDLLLTSQGDGMDAVLKAAEDATLESIRMHHAQLLQNPESTMECLYTGNVSQKDSAAFFDSVSKRFEDAFARIPKSKKSPVWIPGDLEKRLDPGTEIEFHFASQNPQEENGAVLVTFQSPVPGFRGDGLSPEASLKNSASIRLISHILREPLFDELRTKQTLGYIVSSYYDRAIAVRPPEEVSLGPMTIPIDFIVILVLSRKLTPPDIVVRINEFLASFRESLKTIPESQIRHHATALSTKLLKPIQKLHTEHSTQMAKISAFAPELLVDSQVSEAPSREAVNGIPWESVRTLANKIESLQRKDLLDAWDNLVLETNRASIVSCVYGSTFPLDALPLKKPFWPVSSKKMVKNSVADLIALRKSLPPYSDMAVRRSSQATASGLPSIFGQNLLNGRTAALARVTAIAVIGAGVAVGWTAFSRSRKSIK